MDGPELPEELVRRRDGRGLGGAVRVDAFGCTGGPSGLLSWCQACNCPMIRVPKVVSRSGHQRGVITCVIT